MPNLLMLFVLLLAPVALISVGLQLKFREIHHDWHLLVWGLGFKLIMAPRAYIEYYAVILRTASAPGQV